jgi:hypothetical protein
MTVNRAIPPPITGFHLGSWDVSAITIEDNASAGQNEPGSGSPKRTAS